MDVRYVSERLAAFARATRGGGNVHARQGACSREITREQQSSLLAKVPPPHPNFSAAEGGGVAAGGTALTSGPDPSEDLRAAHRLTALSDEQLRAASPRELADTLREASRQQGLLQALAASLAQLQERAAQALGDKLPGQ